MEQIFRILFCLNIGDKGICGGVFFEVLLPKFITPRNLVSDFWKEDRRECKRIKDWHGQGVYKSKIME